LNFLHHSLSLLRPVILINDGSCNNISTCLDFGNTS
jgi:hypothetical protein